MSAYVLTSAEARRISRSTTLPSLRRGGATRLRRFERSLSWSTLPVLLPPRRLLNAARCCRRCQVCSQRSVATRRRSSASGAYRMFVPKELGGMEADPLTFLRVVELAAEAAAGSLLGRGRPAGEDRLPDVAHHRGAVRLAGAEDRLRPAYGLLHLLTVTQQTGAAAAVGVATELTGMATGAAGTSPKAASPSPATAGSAGSVQRWCCHDRPNCKYALGKSWRGLDAAQRRLGRHPFRGRW